MNSESNNMIGTTSTPPDGQGAPRPPAPPPLSRGARERPMNEERRFEEEFQAMGDRSGARHMLEALLKRPAALVYELMRGRTARVTVPLVLTAALCFFGYGLVMGFFSGGQQLWATPLKLAAAMFGAALICLPSLYVFTALYGGKQDLPQSAGLLLMALALSGLLLAGFAPIAWVFSQSTQSLAFMGFIHLLFWLVAIGFGLRLLRTAFGFLNGRRMFVLNLWGVIFAVVALQMSTTLRPILGKPDHGLLKLEKKFFVAHWADCMDRGERAE